MVAAGQSRPNAVTGVSAPWRQQCPAKAQVADRIAQVLHISLRSVADGDAFEYVDKVVGADSAKGLPAGTLRFGHRVFDGQEHFQVSYIVRGQENRMPIEATLACDGKALVPTRLWYDQIALLAAAFFAVTGHEIGEVQYRIDSMWDLRIQPAGGLLFR